MDHSMIPYMMDREWNLTLVIILFIGLLVWSWAIYATITYWNDVPNWVQIIALLGLFTNVLGGPFVSIILIYVMKNK